LENLFASANQIKSIDVNGLLGLKELTSLDLSNNDISQVPPLLGNVEWLRHLELGGNPFRIPRVNILSKGTASVLEYLRDRIPQ
jgi:Leucine-rich repeat (LRR) protein